MIFEGDYLAEIYSMLFPGIYSLILHTQSERQTGNNQIFLMMLESAVTGYHVSVRTARVLPAVEVARCLGRWRVL